MSAIRHQRASRAFPALTLPLALAWMVSVASPAPADGLAAATTAATSANGRAAVVRQYQPFGGLVADRRDRPGRHGPILLGMQTGALATLLLVAAGSRSPTAVRPRRQPQQASIDARAPPPLRLA